MLSKRKIGIVTFGNNVNYGGALQEFALYYLLKDVHYVKAIYYDDPLIRANSQPVRYGFFVAALMVLKGELGSGAYKTAAPKGTGSPLSYMIKEGLNQIKVLGSDILHMNSRKRLVENFNNFFNSYLERTSRYSLDDFRKQRYERFDVLISGSDQIWNPKKFGLSEIYFLAFDQGRSKKLSYASSFGNFDFPDGRFTKKIGEYLSDYSEISVRESESAFKLKELYGMDAKTVLDPTLLLTKEEWCAALALDQIKNSEREPQYLLVYTLGNKKNIMPYAKRVAKKLGLMLYVLDQKPLYRTDRNVRFFSQAGPREFVELIANASFVVTNSFHATAFALNFNVPFYTVSSLVPQRLSSLLGMMGLQDRILPFKPELDETFCAEVDFAEQNRLLAEQRKESAEFLFSSIEKENNIGRYQNVSDLEKHKCCGCEACANACPQRCIEMRADDEGFLYPEVVSHSCIKCSKCFRVCPSLNIFEPNLSFHTYICKSKDDEVRSRASSGGMFFSLAEATIACNGRVAGASMENLRCRHKIAETTEECITFCGSKYVQSEIGEVFSKIKENLEMSRPVLFSGAPCQVAGLKRFLKHDHPLLCCVDFICHGVPSPGVFEKYIMEQQEKYHGTIQDIAFRHKLKGWDKASSMKYTLSGGQIALEEKDRYLLGFRTNLFLRPSCHCCKANKFRSGSDITIADYWGAISKYKGFYDRKGISLVIVKTEKGDKLFREVSGSLNFMEADIGHAAKFQSNLFASSHENRNRKAFFEGYKEGRSFFDLAQDYIKEYPAYRIKKVFGTELPFCLYNILKKDETVQ